MSLDLEPIAYSTESNEFYNFENSGAENQVIALDKEEREFITSLANQLHTTNSALDSSKALGVSAS